MIISISLSLSISSAFFSLISCDLLNSGHEYTDVRGYMQVYAVAGVRGCMWCVWDEFSEYLLETWVLTSADFNTYPIRIFWWSYLNCKCKNLFEWMHWIFYRPRRNRFDSIVLMSILILLTVVEWKNYHFLEVATISDLLNSYCNQWPHPPQISNRFVFQLFVCNLSKCGHWFQY